MDYIADDSPTDVEYSIRPGPPHVHKHMLRSRISTCESTRQTNYQHPVRHKQFSATKRLKTFSLTTAEIRAAKMRPSGGGEIRPTLADFYVFLFLLFFCKFCNFQKSEGSGHAGTRIAAVPEAAKFVLPLRILKKLKF